jgi:RNA-directed DNA polymerase
MLEKEVIPLVEEFLRKRGLKTEETKTKILNIHQGFDFLGFNIKRQKRNLKLNKPNIHQPESILIVRPSKKEIAKLKTNIRFIID